MQKEGITGRERDKQRGGCRQTREQEEVGRQRGGERAYSKQKEATSGTENVKSSFIS